MSASKSTLSGLTSVLKDIYNVPLVQSVNLARNGSGSYTVTAPGYFGDFQTYAAMQNIPTYEIGELVTIEPSIDEWMNHSASKMAMSMYGFGYGGSSPYTPQSQTGIILGAAVMVSKTDVPKYRVWSQRDGQKLVSVWQLSHKA